MKEDLYEIRCYAQLGKIFPSGRLAGNAAHKASVQTPDQIFPISRNNIKIFFIDFLTI